MVAGLWATVTAIRHLSSFADTGIYEAHAALRSAILDCSQSWSEHARHPTYDHMFQPITFR